MPYSDQVVLGAFEEQLLHPEAVSRGLRAALAEFRQPEDAGEQERLKAEMVDVGAQLARLVEAIGLSRVEIPALLAQAEGSSSAGASSSGRSTGAAISLS